MKALLKAHSLRAKSKFAFTLGSGTLPLCTMSKHDIKQAKKEYGALLKTKPQFAIAIRKKSIAQFNKNVPHIKWDNIKFSKLKDF